MDPVIITALDFPDSATALSLSEKLDPTLTNVKVGKELFTRAGPSLVEQLQTQGFNVFLDLKFHDIPNTVAGALRACAELGVWMVNVHAGGGTRMLEAARKAIPEKGKTQLIAVTVLTSLTDEDLAKMAINESAADHVMRLASMTQQAGLDGVVCSPQESSALTERFGDSLTLVTPGVRPEGSDSSDQRRVMTPVDALAAGSDHLVIGRPITQSDDPLASLAAIAATLNA